MSKQNQNTTDELSKLFVDPDNASKTAKLIADIKDPAIRSVFASLIKAKVSDGACRQAICKLIDHNPEAAKVLVQHLPFTNSSAFRQALAKGFDLPANAGLASIEGLGL